MVTLRFSLRQLAKIMLKSESGAWGQELATGRWQNISAGGGGGGGGGGGETKAKGGGQGRHKGAWCGHDTEDGKQDLAGSSIEYTGAESGLANLYGHDLGPTL